MTLNASFKEYAYGQSNYQFNLYDQKYNVSLGTQLPYSSNDPTNPDSSDDLEIQLPVPIEGGTYTIELDNTGD